MDVAHAEAVEKKLNNFIERRSRKGDVDPDEQEELWKASVRNYNARRDGEIRAAWIEYHRDHAARHRAILEAIVAFHEGEVRRLMDA